MSMEANENTPEAVQEAAQFILRNKATGYFFDGELFYALREDACPLTEPQIAVLFFDFQREFIEIIAA